MSNWMRPWIIIAGLFIGAFIGGLLIAFIKWWFAFLGIWT